jgi:hypothetical protein
MNQVFQNELVQKLAGFLQEIGLKVIACKIEGPTFLPGLQVESGRLLVDESRLLYPGDLLHEAGHLAVVPPEVRRKLSGELLEAAGGEMDLIEVAAMAWSYAVCVHLALDPRVVFHAAGYRGKSEALLLGFSLGVFPGANQLAAAGMTLHSQSARAAGAQTFPKMLKWLRE